MEQASPKHHWFTIFCLVFAGEMIFSLPFHIARYFRPTMLDVFQLTNTKLGDAIAIYGITAMISYFPGGLLADRFSAKKIMSISLVATALGGFYLYSIPGFTGLAMVFGFWGVTTILLFWAAMIRATREWGGEIAQGRAFGLLDGGRGLVAAGAATLAVWIFAGIIPENVPNTNALQQKSALKAVIMVYTLLTLAASFLVWFFIPDRGSQHDYIKSHPFKGMKEVVKSRVVWLQAIIVVSAYCGYKGLDFYSLYGVEILDMDEVSSAAFVSYATYLRAFAAISAGLLVDRFSGTKIITGIFSLLTLSYLILGFSNPELHWINLVFANLIFTFIAVYALRGVYFALLEETKIKKGLTGTAVGLISVIGYTPDVFLNSVAGRILDASPGLPGFQHFYLFLAFFGIAGLVATIILLFILQPKS